MLVLHQFTQSPFCVQLRRIMAYKKLAFEVRTHPLADLRRVRRFNPIGKLPALEHRGQWVADSTDIAHYLERQFPDVPILPATPREAALSHVLEDWADESLYFYEMRLRFTFASSARRNLPRMVAMDRGLARWLLLRLIPRGLNGILARQGLGRKTEEQVMADVERHLDALVALLEPGLWLLPGETPTLADFAVHAMLECIGHADEGGEVLDRRPALGRWMARLDDLAPDPHPD